MAVANESNSYVGSPSFLPEQRYMGSPSFYNPAGRIYYATDYPHEAPLWLSCAYCSTEFDRTQHNRCPACGAGKAIQYDPDFSQCNVTWADEEVQLESAGDERDQLIKMMHDALIRVQKHQGELEMLVAQQEHERKAADFRLLTLYLTLYVFMIWLIAQIA